MNFDFSGLRLDWCRLQSYVSNAQVGKPGLLLDAFKATGIAALLNTIVFHTVINLVIEIYSRDFYHKYFVSSKYYLVGIWEWKIRGLLVK